jgi:hypothetical protein
MCNKQKKMMDKVIIIYFNVLLYQHAPRGKKGRRQEEQKNGNANKCSMVLRNDSIVPHHHTMLYPRDELNRPASRSSKVL